MAILFEETLFGSGAADIDEGGMNDRGWTIGLDGFWHNGDRILTDAGARFFLHRLPRPSRHHLANPSAPVNPGATVPETIKKLGAYAAFVKRSRIPV
jgi:hypothetical protein